MKPALILKSSKPPVAGGAVTASLTRIHSLPVMILVVMLLLSGGPSLRAEDPPGIVNHQGRIAVNGVNHHGPGHFKFSLVKDAGEGTEAVLWHHDGTALGTAEPDTALNLTVSKGHYAVLLGEANAIAASVFADNANVSLRIWFSTDGVAFEQLAPDRRLASAAYALSAGSVSGDSVATNNLTLPATTASEGIIYSGSDTLLHSFGTNNFFAGPNAGNLTMTGSFNGASGPGALAFNTTGHSNTASGYWALHQNTTGHSNTASGRGALRVNTAGSYNTASGSYALFSNTTGSFNTANGLSALRNNTEGGANTASGSFALFSNTTGDFNTAIGRDALRLNIGGFHNTASGSFALYSNTTGESNTASGRAALQSNTTGTHNIGLGRDAGGNLTTGDHNIAIGNAGVAAESATIRIGDSDQTRTFVAGIRGVTTDVNDAVAVMIDSNGQLGTVSSSQRYKQDIADMGEASRVLGALRPVTFRYREAHVDGDKPIQYGLIAEEVAEVFPDLAVFNDEGQPETVKYHLLAPLLLNEVQWQQRRLDESAEQVGKLKEENAEFRKQNRELKKRLQRLEQSVFGSSPVKAR